MNEIELNRENFGLSDTDYLRTVYKWHILDLVYVIVVFVLDLTIMNEMHPFERQFMINDPTLQHPFTEEETVPVTTLLAIGAIVPFIVFAITNWLFTPPGYKKYVLYVSYLGLAVSMVTCDFLVTILKNWIGRCRPDFISRCVPRKDAIYDTLYYAKDVCTTDNIPRLLEGFRSTPSGHSSMSFSCFGYLTMWLLGQFVAFSNKYVGSWRLLVCSLPTVLALYVALSRTQDYRHHFFDIIFGGIIGQLFAWWGYRRYFPAITNQDSYVPTFVLSYYEKGDADCNTRDFYEENGLIERSPPPADLEAGHVTERTPLTH